MLLCHIRNINFTIKLTFTEYASDSVTASGSPSGTATTNTVTPIIKCFTKLLAYVFFHGLSSITKVLIQNWIIKIITVSTAIVDPAYPICIANFVNLACSTDFSFLCPASVTAEDEDWGIWFPSDSDFVPSLIIGCGACVFFIWELSPK